MTVVDITNDLSQWTPPAPPVLLAVLPFHHTYGLQVFAVRACADPLTVAIVPKWDPKRVLAAIPRYVPTYDALRLSY